MKLDQIRGVYDGAFSLGSKCLGAIQLRDRGLRPCSGVLDWMLSPSLPHVCLLLEMRFQNFMSPSNLTFIERAGGEQLLYDLNYEITLVHDLLVDLTTMKHDLNAYPFFYEKLIRRITRFLHICNSGYRLLFVRLNGTLDEAYRLQAALSNLVRGGFHILLINDGVNFEIVEEPCSSDGICAIRMPLEIEVKPLWDEVFRSIILSNAIQLH
ncbi:papain-like cysteine peptidase [Paenibacillus sp. SC116]|uniref:papain-like cysteine peptidase n=1 Tax=Paenibacillus sp. SC116 TaxID=2968986 RepID=UPI00215AE9C6|nr:papain-like cysteine peptidase [Paenibacillus sp. SC116]MCR8845276.1 papain-like cysteine peptidase [Paenibacillus sp. SC116]